MDLKCRELPGVQSVPWLVQHGCHLPSGTQWSASKVPAAELTLTLEMCHQRDIHPQIFPQLILTFELCHRRGPVPKFFPDLFWLLKCVTGDSQLLVLSSGPWGCLWSHAGSGCRCQCRCVPSSAVPLARPLPSAPTCTYLPQLVCFTHCLIYISGKLYTTNGSNSSSSSSHHHAAVCGALYPELRSRPAGAGRTDGCSTGNCLPWLCSLTEFLF